MTVPPPEALEPYPLGDGLLSFGATGSAIDISGYVNNATISWEKEEGDSTTKLDGTVRAGATTYTATLGGNMDIDVANPDGFFALTWMSKGTETDFSFTPNEDAGTTVTGRIVLDPLDLGGDTMGETMVSDFEFTVVGTPTLTVGGGVVMGASTGGGDADLFT